MFTFTPISKLLPTSVALLLALSGPAFSQQQVAPAPGTTPQSSGAMAPVEFSTALKAVQTYLRISSPPAIIQVEGEGGRSQPGEWSILLYDLSAKPSYRRLIKVEGNVISYDKGPVQLLAGSNPPLIDISKLRISSKEAFEIANKRAINARVPFNHADYRLQPSTPSLVPIWTLTLVDDANDVTGRVQISGLDGRVLFETWTADKIIPPATPQEHQASSDAQQLPPAEEEQALEKVGRSVDRTIDRVGESISNLFRRD